MKTLFLAIASAIFLFACAEEAILAPGEQLPPRSVQIVNGRDSAMIIFRASTIKDTSWGADRLRHRILFPGHALTLNLNDRQLCFYDFLAEFNDGETIDERKINVCQISQWIAE